MNKDLDIQHYTYEDLLLAFKTNKEDVCDLDKLRKKREKIKQTYPENIVDFYDKAFKIIETIYELFQQNTLLSLIDIDVIQPHVEKIKRIPSFEKMYPTEIIKYLDLTQQQKLQNPPPPPVCENNPIINVFPNVSAPGSLNSLKRITQMQNLNLNSCFRHNYYDSPSTDFDYLLPTEVKNVISMRLASIELPNSWYLFSQTRENNHFIIQTRLNNVVTSFPITVPDGNYDNDTLSTYLNNTYFYNSGTSTPLQYIEFKIPDFNLKTTFQTTGLPAGSTFSFSLLFQPTSSQHMMKTMGWILGFRLPNYLNQSTLQSEGLFDGNGDRYIYLSLTDYQYNTNSTNLVGFDQSSMDEDILAKVPLIQGKLSMVIEDNQCPLTKKRVYNGPVNLRKFHVTILDAFGDVVTLNDMDFSFTLELEILYESFQFRDVTA
jgi:hypothetical protein